VHQHSPSFLHEEGREGEKLLVVYMRTQNRHSRANAVEAVTQGRDREYALILVT
jgi:hypothetical protein